jgi:hypothetical protein
MSRSGRPSERAKHEPHKRNLVGPHEILRSIQRAGGVPDAVVEELGAGEPSDATNKAASEMLAVTQNAIDMVEAKGGKRLTVGDEPERQMAWILSITNSMKESVPRKKRCRHIRAADPNVTEIRSMAFLSAGVWQCVECLKQAGPSVLEANLWPNECDLCGAQTEKFNELAGNIPGCMVNGSVCDHCASFLQQTA